MSPQPSAQLSGDVIFQELKLGNSIRALPQPALCVQFFSQTINAWKKNISPLICDAIDLPKEKMKEKEEVRISPNILTRKRENWYFISLSYSNHTHRDTHIYNKLKSFSNFRF